MGLFFFQPDSSVEPLFDAIVRNGIVNDMFSMQLCGNKFNGTAQGVLVGGTSLSQFLVSFILCIICLFMGFFQQQPNIL